MNLESCAITAAFFVRYWVVGQSKMHLKRFPESPDSLRNGHPLFPVARVIWYQSLLTSGENVKHRPLLVRLTGGLFLKAESLVAACLRLAGNADLNLVVVDEKFDVFPSRIRFAE